MVSDQWWYTIWQWYPEELKDDRYLLQVIGRVTFFMSPGSGRIPLATEVVEATMVNLVTVALQRFGV